MQLRIGLHQIHSIREVSPIFQIGRLSHDMQLVAYHHRFSHTAVQYRPDSSVNGRGTQHDCALGNETTIITHYQCYLIFIITWYLQYLYPNNNLTQGLSHFPPQTAKWNMPAMFVQVLD